MVREYLGLFSKYEDVKSELQGLLAAGAIFMRNDAGKDWYELISEQENTGFIYVMSDSDGVVISCEKDPSKLCPLDFHVWKIPADVSPQELAGMACAGGKYSVHDGWLFEDRRHETKMFERVKLSKMSKLSSNINHLTELMEDGDATPEEISELASLKQRRSVLRRVTPEMVESDGWPE